MLSGLRLRACFPSQGALMVEVRYNLECSILRFSGLQPDLGVGVSERIQLD